MSFLGNEGAILYGEVVYALSDDNISVIEGVLPNLGDILKLLVQAKLISPDAMVPLSFIFNGQCWVFRLVYSVILPLMMILGLSWVLSCILCVYKSLGLCQGAV